MVELIVALVAAFASGGLGHLVGRGRMKAQNRLDEANARRTDAEAEGIEVRTARELVAEVRAEMDRRVSDLDRELGRLRGHLESTRAERDRLLKREAELAAENAQLRRRVEALEARIAELTAQLQALGSAPA